MTLHNTHETARGVELSYTPKDAKSARTIVIRLDGTSKKDGVTSAEVPADFVQAAKARIKTLNAVGLQLSN